MLVRRRRMLVRSVFETLSVVIVRGLRSLIMAWAGEVELVLRREVVRSSCRLPAPMVIGGPFGNGRILL